VAVSGGNGTRQRGTNRDASDSVSPRDHAIQSARRARDEMRWRVKSLAAAPFAAIILALACTFSPDLSRYEACGANGSCPAGYECWTAENRCLPSCSTAPACGPDAGLSILPEALPAAIETRPYRADLSAGGGVAPYTFRALAPLPAGLQLDDAGALSGAPEDAGAYPVALQVDDSSAPPRTTTAGRTLAVRALLRLAGPVTLADAAAGQPYQEGLSATGGDGGYRFSLAGGGSLPGGLTLAQDGSITGATNDAGAASFDVQVTDNDAPAQSAVLRVSVNVIVLPLALEIATRSLPDGRLGTPYSYRLQRFAGAGASQWTLTAGALPQNMGLDTSSGVISGTPTARGHSAFTIQLQDSVTSTQATFGIDVH
jgi:hypothetical protein